MDVICQVICLELIMVFNSGNGLGWLSSKIFDDHGTLEDVLGKSHINLR